VRVLPFLAALPLVTGAGSARVPPIGAAAATAATEILESVGALAPHIAGSFDEPAGFAQTARGDFIVFDRGGHSVHHVDRRMTTATRLVAIGHEPGRVIRPVAFSAARDGSFTVADVPGGRQRVQVFTAAGQRLRGFLLPGIGRALVSIGGTPLNGIGSVQYDGETILLNQPETGSLIVEYTLEGRVRQTLGALRPTGYEGDSDVHLALNTGLPLPHPHGGFYFVFQTGEPRFRRYGADGALQYERVIQGRELDGLMAANPTRWPARPSGTREVPLVPPYVRTAAVDRNGRLWVALVPPYTYVYEGGEKTRTVQFRGAGLLSPVSLSFSPDGQLLVAPGCFMFDPGPPDRRPERPAGGSLRRVNRRR
jgi:hypothetical protein